ncbi:M20 metallopeptidase family protein [Flavobacterium johnsoniae]|uniref:Amidohydrolase peptidase family M20D n=1 Tax=Flavobacterium johnsoniae (strain ATCC 17061 / DSM 2064 / JCM 8514 / BCRC 14874 / CCUG 350202 / NBRC 14942 / NCIMB 11054 / UW101) TaxID=376686 RepID=A5FB23_FLAJ1|nr:M20/M25/M40 family metallo-hydrolase [Flavobacterium johnsoniae]ABQ07602.1 amidohydrolase; peptidase family M20D [Flavobacterium johnsoniae UW101]OXE99497.1 amidohydrolase [Flavobacterium johnsoniae UW101]WQG80560.1 M20/M25/M40 family metallo-hydrolase [Flavobacterium johnsoniae UW101]SHL08049.1 amidohydrolase [Flavobacterium johnsoniae]
MKQILLALLILIFSTQQILYGQKAKSNINIQESIKLETDKIFDKLVQIRRDFHENPELAGKEKRTQEVVKQHLLDLGLQVETDIYGYGLLGILKGDKKGKNIAWRTDMDALPNDFPDKSDFKSKVKGVQHGCGHDVHLAVALGIAEVLAKHKKSLQGTVYFIFQPEEETFKGAKAIVENKKFAQFKLDEIYALHVTALPAGQIMVKPNEMYAYQKEIGIQFKNVLSKEEVKDLSAKIRKSLVRTINGSKPWEIQSILDPKIGLRNPNTIFKDYLIADENFRSYSKNDTFRINAEIYETDASRVKNIIPAVEQVIKDNNFGSQLLSVSFIKENPTVLNHPDLTRNSVNTLENIYGKGFVTADYGQIPYFNDDFAYFQQKVPGVYFLLGGSNFEKGNIAMNHAPNFEVDEECIRSGVKTFSSLLFQRGK